MNMHVETPISAAGEACPIFPVNEAVIYPQQECEAAKMGRSIGILWDKILDSHDSEFDSLSRIFTGCKTVLAVEPANSLAGVLAKLAVARETINETFDGQDKTAATQKARHTLLHLLIDDAMLYIQKQAGVTVEELGLQTIMY